MAAFIGTFLARLLVIPTVTSGIDWLELLELLVQVIVAAVLVFAVAGMYGRRSVNR